MQHPLAKFFIGALLAVVINAAFPFLSPAEEPTTASVAPEDMELTTCTHKGLGIKILCGPKWQLQPEETGLTLIITQSDQESTKVTVSKSKEAGLFYEDLIPSALQRVYGYADGFQYERSRLNERPMVKIVGALKSKPDEILMDYFLLAGTQLYRISFSVDSEQTLHRYEKLFDKLINSFDFIGFPGSP